MPSLWSTSIKTDVRSPLSILSEQAQLLTNQTKGLLVGDVSSKLDSSKKSVVHSLDIVVPLLDGYRHRILAATHADSMVYPVKVDAAIYEVDTSPVAQMLRDLQTTRDRKKPENVAESDGQFMSLVGSVLESAEVVAVAQSLIAKANDERLKAR